MRSISSQQSIYELVTSYPEIGGLMAELGFKDILKPGMLQTMGKLMTIEKGARMKSIPIETIKETFRKNDFNLR